VARHLTANFRATYFHHYWWSREWG